MWALQEHLMIITGTFIIMIALVYFYLVNVNIDKSYADSQYSCPLEAMATTPTTNRRITRTQGQRKRNISWK